MRGVTLCRERERDDDDDRRRAATVADVEGDGGVGGCRGRRGPKLRSAMAAAVEVETDERREMRMETRFFSTRFVSLVGVEL